MSQSEEMTSTATVSELPQVRRAGERAGYPYNFSTIREGDLEPALNKTVKWLIDSDDAYIVYIDSDDYVEWTMNDNELLGQDTGPLLNKIGWLESVNTQYLRSEQKESYKRMIGEGIARLFQKNADAASAALDSAEKWITARNTEVARGWYLTGSGIAALLCALMTVALGLSQAYVLPVLGATMYKLLMGVSVGGLGAWLSVIQRNRTTDLEVSAGPMLHYCEGIFRIMVGMLGSLLVALALHSGLLLPAQQFAAVMVICMVAGASERLVPSFIEQMESRVSANKPA